jgi:hypothetical protein
MHKKWQKNLVLLSAVLCLGVLTMRAMADGSDVSAQSSSDLGRLLGKSETQQGASVNDGGILRLTNNKNEIIRLDQDAASVIVNNPEHIAVMLDSPRLLIVLPRQSGATSFTVLNAKGETILEKDVIVSNVKEHYVRIRKACSGSNQDCVPASYYYCPDGCYEVTSTGGATNSQIPAVVSSGSSSAATPQDNSTIVPANPDGTPPAPSAAEPPVELQQGTEP